MTEQELREIITNYGDINGEGTVGTVMNAAKAYAGAREEETKRQLALCERMKSAATDMLCANEDEINELKAEIQRLREFVQQCHKAPEKLVVVHCFENGGFDYCDLVPLQDAAASVLAPAPVTPTIDQMIEYGNMTMMQRLEKRMPPFYRIDSPKNEDQK